MMIVFLAKIKGLAPLTSLIHLSRYSREISLLAILIPICKERYIKYTIFILMKILMNGGWPIHFLN